MYTRARLGYLAAMGLAAVACKSSDAPVTAPVGSHAGLGPVPNPTTAEVDASSSPTPTANATDTPPDVTTRPSQMHVPSCPSGKFCVAEPKKVGADAGAPAPYAKCAATAVDPADSPDAGPTRKFVTFNAEDTAAARANDPKACCYNWVIPCPGGRPLRATPEDAPCVAEAMRRGDWTAAIAAIDAASLDADERARRAAHWTREAAFEHASIASFAEATLALMAVGAPPELLAELQRAALDEVEHAKIAFALARAYGGEAVGPSPLPLSPARVSPTLREVARSTFADGCVGETIAQLVVKDAADREGDPAVAALLARIADDEARHAALAWKTLAWALRVGGAEVARAIEADVRALRSAPPAKTEIERRAIADVILPCAVALLADHASAASASARSASA